MHTSELKILVKDLIRENIQLLLCGGLGGHLSHIYENPSLTFSDIKEILTSASEGQLESVSEKLDGQNIYFSFNATDNSLRFARNKGDLKRRGMTQGEVDSKWTDKPSVQQAFSTAFKMLDAAVKTLGKQEIIDIFGPNADIWYSAEILASVNPNVINYDRNVIVPHEFGVNRLVADEPGEFDPEFESQAQFQKLKSVIVRLQQSLTEKGWDIMEPVLYPLKALSDKTALKTALSKIDQEMSSAGLSDINTVGDYLNAKIMSYMAQNGLSQDIAVLIAKRFLDDPDKPTLSQIKKYVATNIDLYEKIVAIDKNKTIILKDAIRPIELTISDFAIELLRDAKSLVALHPDRAVREMKDQVGEAIKGLQASRENTEFLSSQLAKLRSIDDITSSMEGIVFRFKGKSLKFTGSFAIINQLLGVYRFGPRGGGRKTTGALKEQKTALTNKIAIFPGAFKPFHRGHYKSIQQIASQVNKLYLIVSTKDRIRPGELPIIGSAMLGIWKKYIEPILPKNVEVIYADMPVTEAFNIMEQIDKESYENNIRLYLVAGKEDISRYKPSAMMKWVPNLYKKKMIEIIDTPRFGNISGTKVRQAILDRDKKSFQSMLPEPLAPVAGQIFNILYKTHGQLS